MVTFTEGVDKFYDIIHAGSVYLISKGALQAAKKVRGCRLGGCSRRNMRALCSSH